MQVDLTDWVPLPLIEQLLGLALARGGDFAEIFLEHTSSHNLGLEEGAIRSATAHLALGLGVRVIAGSEVGYAYSDDLEPTVLRQTASIAASIARGGRTATARALAVRQLPQPDRYHVSQQPDAVPLAARAALLLRASQAAYAHDPRIRQVTGACIDSRRSILIANSLGLLARDVQPMCRLHIATLAEDGKNERRSGFYGGGGRVGLDHFESFTPGSIGQEAARMAIAQLGAGEAPAGPQTVVLSPGWSGILLHEAVGHGLEADFIHRRTSLFAGKLGERVAGPLCTVIDSGCLPHARGSLNIDDEGAVAQEKVLIEKGILRSYMADHLSGQQLGTGSTGNGRRQSYAHAPMPRMTNTYMAPGPHSHDEIVASVQSGLYCAALGGGQVDITNGNFVFEVREGYRIEAGRITQPVKNATLIGIGPEAMQRISMVGNDCRLDPGLGMCGKDGQGVPVGVGLPTLRLDNLTVGGTHVGR